MVNRGYSSQSAMHDTALRFLEQEDKKHYGASLPGRS